MLKINKKQFAISAFAILLAVSSFWASKALFGADISFEQPEELGDMVVIKLGAFASKESVKENLAIEPNVEGELIWVEEKNAFHFVPQDGFKPGQTYTVSFGNSSAISASLTYSSEVFTFSPVSFGGQVLSDPPEITEGKYIDINLSTMQATLVNNGQVVGSYPVAGKGSPWKPTREGVFRILTKEENHFSRISHVWMPYSMQYSGNYFVHEWPYWPGGRPIQSKYSSGCVRFFPGDAKQIYDWAQVGTRVVVHSTPGRLAVFPSTAVRSGDMVREESNSSVYIVKHTGTNRFKRHVWTPRFAEWYSHLHPFWQRVKVVPDGTLNNYIASRWVMQGGDKSAVYELNTDTATKHPLVCGKTPMDTVKKQEYCADAWSAYGWPAGEIYTVSADELSAYQTGPAIQLKPAPELLN